MDEIPLPGGGSNRIKLSRSDYIKGFIGLAVFLLLIVLYALEFKHFHNTFSIGWLILFSALFGTLAGAFLGRYFSRNANDLLEVVQTYVFFVSLSALVMPLFGSLSNRLLAYSEVESQSFELFQQNVFSASRFGTVKGQKVKPDGYYVFFFRNDKLERIKTKKLLFPNANRGDEISLPVKKGFWGFEFVLINE